jgi:hypothetical protein
VIYPLPHHTHSSIRLAAGTSGFFTFTQSGERPDLSGAAPEVCRRLVPGGGLQSHRAGHSSREHCPLSSERWNTGRARKSLSAPEYAVEHYFLFHVSTRACISRRPLSLASRSVANESADVCNSLSWISLTVAVNMRVAWYNFQAVRVWGLLGHVANMARISPVANNGGDRGSDRTASPIDGTRSSQSSPCREKTRTRLPSRRHMNR